MNFHAAGATLVRASISLQLQEFCKYGLLDYAVTTVEGRLVYVIEGQQLTPREAAEKYLGGFDAAYGRSGDEFEAFIAAANSPQDGAA